MAHLRSRLAVLLLILLPGLAACSDDSGVNAEGATGTVEVTVTTNIEVLIDFEVSIGDGAPVVAEPNQKVVFEGIPAGGHQVRLGNNRPIGCALEGSTTRAVTVSADEVSRVVFEFFCFPAG